MRNPPAGVLMAAFLVAGAVDLVAELAELQRVIFTARLVMMPLLAGFVLAATVTRDRLVWLAVAALVWSGLGDALGTTLVVKITFFLVAQIIYVVAFWPFRRRALGGRPVQLAAFSAAVLVLVAVAARDAGPLAPAVAAYGISLGLMVLLATGLNRLAALGGALFLLSDVVLAAEFFVRPGLVWQVDFVNMALYLPAQLFLALGVVQQNLLTRQAADLPATSPG